MLFLNSVLFLLLLGIAVHVYSDHQLYIRNEERLAKLYAIRFRLAYEVYRDKLDEDDVRYRAVMEQINVALLLLRDDFPLTIFVKALINQIRKHQPPVLDKIMKSDDIIKSSFLEFQDVMCKVVTQETRAFRRIIMFLLPVLETVKISVGLVAHVMSYKKYLSELDTYYDRNSAHLGAA